MAKTFWDKAAGIYHRFMKKDEAAYAQMLAYMRPIVRDKTVLELATGTGDIAKQLVCAAAMIEATDASPQMIAEARKGQASAKLHFSVQDMFHLPYADQSFDVVIVSNALHIVPEPEKALDEIRRVLRSNGVLITPTFVHAQNNLRARFRAFLMRRVGFPLHSKWSNASYLRFLRENGWTIEKNILLSASFPLAYVECRKTVE